MHRLILFLLVLFSRAIVFSQGITLLYTGGGTKAWNDPASWTQIKVPAGQTPIQRVPTEWDDVVFSKVMSGLNSAGFSYNDSVEVGGTNPAVNRCRSLRISNMTVNWGIYSDQAPPIHVYTTNGGHFRIDSGGNMTYGRLYLHGGNADIYDLEIVDSKYGELFTHGVWSSVELMPKGRAKIVNSSCEGWNFGSYPMGGELYAEKSTFMTPSFVMGDSSKSTILDCTIRDGNNFVSVSFGIGHGSDFTSRNVDLRGFGVGLYSSGTVFNGNVTTEDSQNGLHLQQKYPEHPLPNIINGNIHVFGNNLDLSGGLKLSGDFVNFAVEEDIYDDSTHVFVNGKHAFKIGGIANYGSDTAIKNCKQPGCHFRLEFFGDKNSNVVWPVGFPIDTLVVNKTNCAKLTFKNSIYVTGETRIESGQLVLDPNDGIPYKLVTAGDVNIAQGGGLFLRRNIDGTAANIAVAGGLHDYNVVADSTCTGFLNPYAGMLTLYESGQTNAEKIIRIESAVNIGDLELAGSDQRHFRLSSNLSIKNLSFLNSGSLLLGNYNLVVTGNLSGYGPSRHVVTDGTGTLRRINVGSTETVFPVGDSPGSYTPLRLTNVGTPDDFSVRVQPRVFANGTSGNGYVAGVVNRTWQVEEGTPGGSNAVINLQWNSDDELPDFTRSNAFLSHHTAGAWDKGSLMTANGMDPFTLSRAGITSFSPFAVMSPSAALPVTLVQFEGKYRSSGVVLVWRTASEINTSIFVVEKSTDGLNFTALVSLPAKGFGGSGAEYLFTDNSPISSQAFYRLKMIDVDGRFAHSKTVLVLAPGEQSVLVFPNPVGDKLRLRLSENEHGAIVHVYDQKGAMLRGVVVAGGSAETTINTAGLPTGIYTLSVVQDGRKTQKIFSKK